MTDQIHSLSPWELEQAEEALGRAPNGLETTILSALWSEHCSYRSSKHLIDKLPTGGPGVLRSIGYGAGAMAVDRELAVVFKVESHNHPSYLEPFQGAATGVGGILRDIFTMGARPVGVLNLLRMGSPGHRDTGRVLPGVVAGIGDYCRGVGVPAVGGDLAFHPGYQSNPLVNVMAVGVCRIKDLLKSSGGAKAGSPIIYVGAPTGREGMGGCTMASRSFTSARAEGAEQFATQVAEPATGRLLMEACVAAARQGLVLAMQDMGAAGISSSSAELASLVGRGVRIELDQIPVALSHLEPEELMLSETQERALLIPREGALDQLEALLDELGITHQVVGHLLKEHLFQVGKQGHSLASLPLEIITTHTPPAQPPANPAQAAAPNRNTAPGPGAPCPPHTPSITTNLDPAGTLEALLGSPALCSREPVHGQFDQSEGYLPAPLLTLPGEGGASVLSLGPGRGAIGVAISADHRAGEICPRAGAVRSVVRAWCHVAATGAEPIGATDGLNLGDPGFPRVREQLEETITGLALACRALNTPVVSGNVSLFNQTGEMAIPPTPAVGVVGKLAPGVAPIPGYFTGENHRICIMGPGVFQPLNNGDPLAGSAWREYLDECDGGGAWDGQSGDLPTPNLEGILRTGRFIGRLHSLGLAQSIRALSDGGLAVALARCAIDSQVEGKGEPTGAFIDLDLGHPNPDPVPVQVPVQGPAGEPGNHSPSIQWEQALFGEHPGMFVATFRGSAMDQVRALARDTGVVLTEVGETGGKELTIHMGGKLLLSTPVSRLGEAWRGGNLPGFTGANIEPEPESESV